MISEWKNLKSCNAMFKQQDHCARFKNSKAIHWQFLAALTLSAVMCFPTYASGAGLANSGGWAYSPVVFVPLENGSTNYDFYISGSLATSTGDGITVQPVITDSTSFGQSNTEILGGFVIGSSFSNVGTGGDAAVANGYSLASSLVTKIIGDATYAGSGSGSGVQNASVTIVPTGSTAASDGDVSTSAGLTNVAFIQGALIIRTDASSSTPGAPVLLLEEFLQTGPSQFVFNNTADGAIFSAAAMGDYPAGVFAGAVGDISANAFIQGNNVSIGSGFQDTSLFGILLNSQTGDVNSEISISGDNAQFSTTQASSIGFQMLANAGDAIDFDFSIAGNDFSLDTIGANAPGVVWTSSSINDTITEFTIGGDNAEIETSGDNSSGLISSIVSQNTTAQQNAVISGDFAKITTSGLNATGLALISNGGLAANNNLTVSGDEVQMGTAGDGSSALALIASGVGENSNQLRITGNKSSLTTTGQNASALFAGSYGGTKATDLISISGNSSTIETLQDGSVGLAILSSASDMSQSELLVTGSNNQIATQGEKALGASLIGSGKTVNTSATLSGNETKISTTGNQAGGIVVAALGEDSGTAELSITGRNSEIRTQGDYATGVYLTASGSQTASANLDINASGAKIQTSGDYSAGVTFAGMNAEMRIGQNGGIIGTSGLNSHGVHLEVDGADLSFSDAANISATGSDSDGIFSQRTDSNTRIATAGNINGNRNGINTLGQLNLTNLGTVSATTSNAVRFDNGYIFNSGVITGPNGITALQTSDDPVNIVTPGAVLSSNGFAGVAIALLGNGDDQLTIGPWTRLSGTLDLGSGNDHLVSLPGTNADLEVVTPIEQINAKSGFVQVLNSGNRIIIFDDTLIALTGLDVAEAIGDLTRFETLFDDNSKEISGDVLDGCGTRLGFTPGISMIDRSQSQDFSQTNLGGFGGVGFLTSSLCAPQSYSIFGGIYSGTATAEASSAEVESYFGGVAGRFVVTPTDKLFIKLGGGTINSNFSRRVINNRLLAGFEINRSSGDTSFVFGKAEWITDRILRGIPISPFASLEFAAGSTEDFGESGVSSGVNVKNSIFQYAKAGLGIAGELYANQDTDTFFANGLDLSVLSRLAFTYSISQTEASYSFGANPIISREITNYEPAVFMGLEFALTDTNQRMKIGLDVSVSVDIFGNTNTSAGGSITHRF